MATLSSFNPKDYQTLQELDETFIQPILNQKRVKISQVENTPGTYHLAAVRGLKGRFVYWCQRRSKNQSVNKQEIAHFIHDTLIKNDHLFHSEGFKTRSAYNQFIKEPLKLQTSLILLANRFDDAQNPHLVPFIQENFKQLFQEALENSPDRINERRKKKKQKLIDQMQAEKERAEKQKDDLFEAQKQERKALKAELKSIQEEIESADTAYLAEQEALKKEATEQADALIAKAKDEARDTLSKQKELLGNMKQTAEEQKIYADYLSSNSKLSLQEPDIQLVCQNGDLLKTHSWILQLIPFFEPKLNPSADSKDKGKEKAGTEIVLPDQIDLTDYPLEMVKHVMNFFLPNIGGQKIHPKDLPDLLQVAQRWGIPDLQERCEDLLIHLNKKDKSESIETACNWIEDNQFPRLVKHAASILVQHRDTREVIAFLQTLDKKQIFTAFLTESINTRDSHLLLLLIKWACQKNTTSGVLDAKAALQLFTSPISDCAEDQLSFSIHDCFDYRILPFQTYGDIRNQFGSEIHQYFIDHYSKSLPPELVGQTRGFGWRVLQNGPQIAELRFAIPLTKIKQKESFHSPVFSLTLNDQKVLLKISLEWQEDQTYCFIIRKLKEMTAISSNTKTPTQKPIKITFHSSSFPLFKGMYIFPKGTLQMSSQPLSIEELEQSEKDEYLGFSMHFRAY